MRVDKEHGLNPTISQCFVCGGGKNDLALLGSSYKGEAPMMMVLDLIPCDDCKKKLCTYPYVVVFEARKDEKDNIVPVGGYVTIHENDYTNIFGDIPKERMLFVDSAVFVELKKAVEDFINKTN